MQVQILSGSPKIRGSMKYLITFCLLLSLSSCSAERKEIIHERLLKMRVAGDHVLVFGCGAAKEIDLAYMEAKPYLPPDPKVQIAELVYDMNKPIAIEICNYIKKKTEENSKRLELLGQ